MTVLKELWPNLLVLALFLLFVIAPGLFPDAFPDWATSTHFGVVHVPSLLFIVGAFFCYVIQNSLSQVVYQFEQRKKGIMPRTINLARKELERTTALKDNKEAMLRALVSLDARNPLVGAVLACVANGYGADVVRRSIDKLTEDLTHHFEHRVRFWNQLSAVLPLLGMTGTIAGLMFMFKAGVGQDSVNLSALSTALLTTLYASLITVLFSKMLFKINSDRLSQIRHLSGQVMRDGEILVGTVSAYDYMNAQQART